MGGCPSTAKANPEPENFCGSGDFIGMTADVPNAAFFTTAIGEYCDGTIQKAFGEAQGSTEWIRSGPGSPAGVCSNCKGLESGNGNGLCSGSDGCSWQGSRQQCKRLAFNGDPSACCRRSKAINGESLFCFDNDNKKNTCDPQYRGFLQPACIGVMAGFCSDDTETSYKNKWSGTSITSDCLRFVEENTGNLNSYKPVISAMVTRYLITENNAVTSPQSSGSAYDPFIQDLINVCRANPGACDDVLKQKCANVKREDLSNNVNLANVCGCFMPDIEYAANSTYGISKECDPVCALGSSIHLLDTTTSNPAKSKECKQAICVIDDVTINVLANSVVGDVSFAQACGNCASSGSSSCRCFITDTTVTAVNSLIGDVSFNQQCGGAPTCYQSAPVAGAPPIQVDCNTGVVIDNGGGSSGGGSGSSSSGPVAALWVAIAIMILIILFIIILAVRSRSGDRQSEAYYVPGSNDQPSRPMIGSFSSATRSRAPISRST